MEAATTTAQAAELESALIQFTGSEQFYRWSAITCSVLSEGAKYLADHAGAYWLFDTIDSHLAAHGILSDTEFVVAHLVRDKAGSGALLEIHDGNHKVLIMQRIEYTDFPLDRITIYAAHNGSGWTHFLPSEY